MPRIATVIALSTIVLAACIYVPRTTGHYNANCEIEERHLTLEAYQVGSLYGCKDQGCVALLVAAGIISAATAVVSGSVVVTGNVVYWLEEKGGCMMAKKKVE